MANTDAYIPLRRTGDRDAKLKTIGDRIGSASDAFVIDFALSLALLHTDFRAVNNATYTKEENWYWWAIQTPAGIRAITEAGVSVNFENPPWGVPDKDRHGHWGVGPYLNPGKQPGAATSWPDVVNELRNELGEPAGMFYVEHVCYQPYGGYSNGTLIAVSDDGQRAVYRRVLG